MKFRYSLIGGAILFLLWLAAVPRSTLASIAQAIIPAAVPTANKTGNSAKFQLGTGSPASGACAAFDVNGNIQDAGVGTCAGSGGGSVAFSGITGATNTAAAMVVGSGASLTATGSGTIVATAVLFSGLTTSTNTAATMTVGTGGSLTTSGSGTINASALQGKTAFQGNGTLIQLSTGSVVSGNCAKFDANGNVVDNGTACGSGSGGGFALIEQHAAAVSATLNFTTCISATYDEYQVEFVNVINATNNVDLWMRMSTDGGATYDAGANYDWARNVWVPSGTGASGAISDTKINVVQSIKNTASWSLNGQVRLFNPGGANFKPTLGQFHNLDNTGGTIIGWDHTGVYRVTTAVNAFQFLFSTGNITSGTIRCYGLAK